MTSPQHAPSISFPLRLAIYIAGGIILALGITLNTKTCLGVSPIVSVPYCISVLAQFPLGILTFLFYGFCILLQFLLLRREFEPIRLCQIFMSFVTSLFIQVFDTILPVPEPLPFRLLLLTAAILLTGIGAAMTVAMQICPNPADRAGGSHRQEVRKNVRIRKKSLRSHQSRDLRRHRTHISPAAHRNRRRNDSRYDLHRKSRGSDAETAESAERTG